MPRCASYPIKSLFIPDRYRHASWNKSWVRVHFCILSPRMQMLLLPFVIDQPCIVSVCPGLFEAKDTKVAVFGVPCREGR